MQSWLAGIIVFAAMVYLGRVAWVTLRPPRAGQNGAGSRCSVGCDGCGESSTGLTHRPLVMLQGLEAPPTKPDSKLGRR